MVNRHTICNKNVKHEAPFVRHLGEPVILPLVSQVSSDISIMCVNRPALAKARQRRNDSWGHGSTLFHPVPGGIINVPVKTPPCPCPVYMITPSPHPPMSFAEDFAVNACLDNTNEEYRCAWPGNTTTFL